MYRIVLIGDFPLIDLYVRRWIWRLLGQEILMPRRDDDMGIIYELCSFRELHMILRRGRRIGLR